jgi:hypothetical protein
MSQALFGVIKQKNGVHLVKLIRRTAQPMVTDAKNEFAICNTANLRWNSKTEIVPLSTITSDLDHAIEMADKLNGIKR